MRVFHCFARSGGTLVNRLLGASAGVAVLSEVGPAGSVRDPVEQALDWLGLVDPGEVDELRALPFGELLVELEGRAAAAGRRLVVRDFCTPNFLPGAFASAEPSGAFDVLAALDAAGAVSRRVAVVRRSAAVYESLVRAVPHLSSLPVGRFAAAYHGYAASLAAVPFVRYEDLVADPAPALARLTDMLDLDADPTALERFAAFTACTGDLDHERSRGSALDHVEALADRAAEPAYVRAAAHPLCRAADERFGYEPLGDAGPAWAAADAYAVAAADGRRRAAALAADLERARAELAEATAAATQVAALRAELEAALGRERERDAALAEQRARIGELHDHLGEQRAAVAAAERRADALRAERDDARQRIEALAAAHDRTSGELARAEAIASERREQVSWLLGRSS